MTEQKLYKMHMVAFWAYDLLKGDLATEQDIDFYYNNLF